MSWALRGPPLSFQAKVLIPVVTIMVVLLVLPTWIFSRRMSDQLESAGAENLRTADAVFNNLQSIRAKNLLFRYRNVPNEPRFRAVAQLSDVKTLQFLLQELMEDFVGDVIQYADDEGRPIARLGRDPQMDLEKFSSRSGQSVRRALAGDPNTETTSVEERLFDIASVPVLVRDNVVGALTFATQIGQGVAQEFKQLTRSDIVLLAKDRIAASTLFGPGVAEELAEPLREMSTNVFSADRRLAQVRKIVLNGEHFMCLTGQLAHGGGDRTLGYVLLSSYEKPLQAMQATQRTSLWICLLGIVVSTTAVWLLLRRITNPLRHLRDSAEAVGRGDFSQRVEVTSRDECGELAVVFNRMTANLKASREQLERTVETLRSTQAQLIQSEKMSAIGTLAGGIAHDFNNILGAIIGFTELLSDDLPPGNRVGNNLREVLKAGHRAKELVRQILAFSRQTDPQRVHLQLGPILEEALGLLRASFPATIQIRTRLDVSVDTVVADSTQMHQVLMNLGTNACYAMRDKGGTLTVALEEFEVPLSGCSEAPQLKPGPYLRCTVEDTGQGMEQSVLDHIFEPFYTTKPVGEGTGLGLSVVHGIVKNHGGEITVVSRPGQGTTFHIFLPRAEDCSPCGANSEAPAPGGHERILLVDDEEPLVNMMQQKLSRLGYVVVAHQDSLEAWKEFESAPEAFDLVITDQTMPRLTGVDLAKRIVQLKSDVPIILCSGSGQAHGRAASLRPAVRECILKPVNFLDLSRTIRRVLETKEPWNAVS